MSGTEHKGTSGGADTSMHFDRGNDFTLVNSFVNSLSTFP